MSVRWQGICLSAVLFGSLLSLAHAQSVATPEDEYRKLIRVNEDIQPLGEHPFGESISLYDGSLTFHQTDVSASGNGPLLQFSRKFQIEGIAANVERTEYAFGDWSIELPHLETLAASGYTYTTQGWIQVNGWQVNALEPNARCTQFAQPLTISQHIGDSALVPWNPASWWKGYHLVMPGQGSEDMLSNADLATRSAYPVVTKSHWRFSCLGSTANGQPGEGFLAQAPDGTKYWFDQLVYRFAEDMSRPLYSDDLSDATRPHVSFFENLMASHTDPVGDLLELLTGSSLAHAVPAANVLSRKKAVMLVTKIQDRFGNTLMFSYDVNGNLKGITASDGRALAVKYVSGTPRVQSVTLQPTAGAPRTWIYTYSTDGRSLTAVTLPDGSQWHYDLTNFNNANLTPSATGSSCITLGAPGSPNPVTGSITHPSGLTGTFTGKSVRHGRSYVPQDCRGTTQMNPATPQSYALIPKAWYGFSITQRVLSGAGMPTATWSYSYSPANDSWADCGSNCPTTVYSNVVSPDGSTVRSTFSNKFDYTESQLLRTDYYAGAVGVSTLLRSEVSDYAAPTTAPLPQNVGYNLQSNVNSQQTNKYSPLSKRVITQDGTTYTWQATAFNTYAQVTKTKRFSNITGQPEIEEQTTYLNDVPHWVLGLPTQTKNLTDNEVVDEYVYDMAKVTLKERWRFGQKLMSYTFNSAGQLATFTDGNTNTTTLSNYKRGIPQTIKTPDNKTETLVMDDFGQIASITDQAGSKTSYNYDTTGRVTGISYPTGDEQTWLPKTFAYAYVTSTERGLAAKHWRRTVSQGNSRAVTYFDALMRPVLSDSYINGVSGSNTSVLTNYDTKGQTVFASYPEATRNFTTTPSGIKGTTSTYDALGRLTQTQQSSELGPLTTTTAYLSGARKQVTDPNGNVTTTSYQVFDQPAYDAVIKVVAPAGVTQTITRDLYGNPNIINQSGTYGTTSLSFNKAFIYDSHYRLCRTIEPESDNTVMGYDDANNLTWSVSGVTLSNDGSCHPELAQSASVITRSYDAMNRLSMILPPSGTQSTTYDYDAVGNLTSAMSYAISGNSTWSATYNKRGMLTGESLFLVGQDPWAIGYAHDTYGHLSLIHYPDGESVSYAPDALGRPTVVGSYLTIHSYHPNGEVAGATLGNGASYLAQQNDRQLLRNFSYGKGGAVNLSEDIVYDKNGNITELDDLGDDGGIRDKTFGYDALNRLTSATAGALWGTETYAYDPINNLRKRVNGSQSTTYNYDSRNRLSSLTGAGATTFGYDLRGNVTSKGGVTLNFDQKNQLLSLPGISYAYDAAGRRVSKTPTSGSPTYSFYNQAGQLMYQVEPGLAKATSYAYLGRKLVGSNESIVLVAPGAVTFSANANNGSYTVSWGAVLAATSYTLQERLNGGSWTTVYTGSAASKALSGRAGGNYVYQVRGCIGSTCGAWSNSATLGVRPALSTVTVPSGTINGSYMVSWTAPASTTGYDVQERLGSGSWTAIASNTTATSISRPGTTSGSYTYRVSAKNSHGSRGWATSSAVTVDTTYGVLPTVPASFTVPATSSTGSASLSWNAATLATRYVVQQGVGSNWTEIHNSSATSKAVSGLANGSYVYRVQACNTYGCSDWRAGNHTLVVTYPPASAATITTPASSTTGSYSVSWGAVSTATSYTLQEQVNGGTWATIQTSSATSKAISGKGNGSYGYRVQACNVGGCAGWSGIKATTVLLKPAAPGSISVPATSSGSIAVSWSASSTATSYTLQQRLGTGSWSNAYTGAATSSMRTVTASGSYTYQVQACNASGCSAYKASSAVTVTIPPASAPTLTVPATSSSGSYTTSWTAVTGATSYTLQERVGGGSWATIQASSARSKAISGKGNGSYGYRVQACNAGGCGGWSSTKTITVALAPPAPTGVQVISFTITNKFAGFKAQWNAVSAATSYNVRRVDTGVTVYTGSATSFVMYQGPQPLDYDQWYDVQVRACNAAGCSGWAP